jgi:hypothetical protein
MDEVISIVDKLKECNKYIEIMDTDPVVEDTILALPDAIDSGIIRFAS